MLSFEPTKYNRIEVRLQTCFIAIESNINSIFSPGFSYNGKPFDVKFTASFNSYVDFLYWYGFALKDSRIIVKIIFI